MHRADAAHQDDIQQARARRAAERARRAPFARLLRAAQAQVPAATPPHTSHSTRNPTTSLT